MPRSATPALVAAFVANGVGIPSFVARLPERQRDLDLTDGALGATVLGAGLGALLASPLAGAAVHRFGSRRTFLVAALASAVTLWLAGAAGSAPSLFAGLVVIGAADATMDVSMNANGAAHEVRSGRSVLHRLHGAWSLGALAGAGLALAAAAADVSVTTHLALVGVLIAACTAFAAGGLVEDRPAAAGRGPAATPGAESAPDTPVRQGTPEGAGAPAVDRSDRVGGVGVGGAIATNAPGPAVASGGRRLLLVLGVATVAAALAEATGSDWSAIQADRAGLPVSAAPVGTAAFMGGMLLGRLLGDRRTDAHGAAVVLRRGMTLGAAGLLLCAVGDHPAPFLVGAAVAGYGVSVFFPLAFAAAIRTSGGAGSATVSIAARLGFIVGPPLVGAVSEATDLRVAFGAAALVALGLASAAPAIAGGRGRPA